MTLEMNMNRWYLWMAWLQKLSIPEIILFSSRLGVTVAMETTQTTRNNASHNASDGSVSCFQNKGSDVSSLIYLKCNFSIFIYWPTFDTLLWQALINELLAVSTSVTGVTVTCDAILREAATGGSVWTVRFVILERAITGKTFNS